MQNLSNNQLCHLYMGYLNTISFTLKVLTIGCTLVCLTLLLSCSQPTGNSAANDNAQQLREKFDERDSVKSDGFSAEGEDSFLHVTTDTMIR